MKHQERIWDIVTSECFTWNIFSLSNGYSFAHRCPPKSTQYVDISLWHTAECFMWNIFAYPMRFWALSLRGRAIRSALLRTRVPDLSQENVSCEHSIAHEHFLWVGTAKWIRRGKNHYERVKCNRKEHSISRGTGIQLRDTELYWETREQIRDTKAELRGQKHIERRILRGTEWIGRQKASKTSLLRRCTARVHETRGVKCFTWNNAPSPLLWYAFASRKDKYLRKTRFSAAMGGPNARLHQILDRCFETYIMDRRHRKDRYSFVSPLLPGGLILQNMHSKGELKAHVI